MKKGSKKPLNDAASSTTRNMRWKSLTFKTPFVISLMLFVFIAILVSVFNVFSSNIALDLTRSEITHVAEQNALRANSYFDSMYVYSQSLADTLLQIRSENLERSVAEGAIVEACKRASESDRVFSAYFAFEPNAVFPDTQSGLSFYAYDSNGTTAMDINNDYATYKDADYYAPARDTLKTHVTDPYEFTLSSGETVWLITLSTPIVDDSGNFIGVANCDILGDSITKLDYSIGSFKTAYTAVTTDTSVYLAQTHDPKLAGTTDPLMTPDILSSVQSGNTILKQMPDPNLGGKSSIIVFTPLTLAGSDLNWVCTFSVTFQEVNAPVLRMVFTAILIAAVGFIIIAVACSLFSRLALQPIEPLVHLAEKMSRYDLSEEADPYVFPDNEFGILSQSFLKMSDSLKAVIADERHLLGEMASGDFTVTTQCEEKYVGALQEILSSIRQIQSTLGHTLIQISSSSDLVSSNSNQVSNGSQSLAQGATEQASSIEELSSMITAISKKISENADSAQAASTLAGETGQCVEESNHYMVDLSSAMQRISDTSAEIRKIINVIDNIAFQTNILALNAAVEAARAGASGKGFAVVADEVRNLAQKSAEAAKSTEDLITTSVDAVADGLKLAEKTAGSLQEVASYTEKNNVMIQDINEASREQASAVEQIKVGIQQISAVIQTNTATAEESAAASEELSSNAQLLKNLVGKFQLPDSNV